jgi:hypothetical protein
MIARTLVARFRYVELNPLGREVSAGVNWRNAVVEHDGGCCRDLR